MDKPRRNRWPILGKIFQENLKELVLRYKEKDVPKDKDQELQKDELHVKDKAISNQNNNKN